MSGTTLAGNASRRVGVIGLGVIGKPIAERLVKAGHSVAVYDVREEPISALNGIGAMACASSADVASRSEIILSLVMDASQTEDVVSGAKGVLETIGPGSIFATGSTIGPAPVHRIAAALAQKQCATLDMPITGGYIAAYEGKLALMLGGDNQTIERAMPVLRAFASVMTCAGGLGAGQAAKLAHQLIMSVNVMALLEGLSLGVAGGVEPGTLKQIIRNGLANSTVLEVWNDLGARWKKMLESAPAGAPLPNLRKDMHTALELARELALELPLGEHASRIADSGTAIGHDNPAL